MNDRRDDLGDDSRDEEKWSRKAPRSLLNRSSRAIRVTEYDEEAGEWREVIRMTKKKILDPEKGIFLREYAKWGRIGEAAAAIGTTPETVRAEMKRDPEFAEGVMVAEEAYRDKLISHHQNLLFNGTQKESYDRNGMLVSTETIYPIRLIEMELKKHDKGYRDKQEVEVTHTGGVLVAPSTMKTIDDWEARYGAAKIVGTDTITSKVTDAILEGVAVTVPRSVASDDEEEEE